MASCSSKAGLVQLLAIYCFVVVCLLQTCADAKSIRDIHILKKCNIDKIYQFGASKHDTGNGKIENPKSRCALPPYGQNFLKEPTGRCSNGLLMIDFIAAAAGLPLLNPSLAKDANFSHGANFAVGGSTALPRQISGRGSSNSTGSYLGEQVEWMSKLFVSECNPIHKDCSPGRHKHSLFIVGETGGNDYTSALFTNHTVADMETNLMPRIVGAIIDAVKTVISQGGEQIIVPGQYPLGCFPVYLTVFKLITTSPVYDGHHCIAEMNNLAKAHNHHLKEALAKLQKKHPNTKIVYADYYHAFIWLLNTGPHKGILLLRFAKARGEVHLKILSIEDGTEHKSFDLHLDQDEEPNFVELFHEKLLIKQKLKNLQILNIRESRLTEISTKYWSPPRVIYLHQNQLFFTMKKNVVVAWDLQGDDLVVTPFGDHLLWGSDSEFDEFYITRDQDVIISFCKANIKYQQRLEGKELVWFSFLQYFVSPRYVSFKLAWVLRI